MPWFRLDDSFDTHPKVITAGNEAVGLYIRCGTYAARHLTDGFVPRDTVLLYGSPALADALVRVKLWHRARGGWTIHDYLDYNPSREAVENERKAAAERQKRWRDARKRPGRDLNATRKNTGDMPVDNPENADPHDITAGQNTSRRRVTNGVTNGVTNTTPTRPAPKEAGREGHPTRSAANGRASPPGSPAVSATPKPPWCGKCSNETTRQIGDPPKRCPDCHPLAAKETA
jgi:hypothetical protein